ncbi:c-type cytochrome [Coralliovum pocilloporae]|uniref:c-type cytochrome n=1 Tax=Coralliovum pocilloporae TaxID=3066369 RepID=UPI0033077330
MDSFELNKIFGALCLSVLIVLVVSNLAGILYHVDKPEKPGFVIEVAEASTGDAQTEEVVEEPSIAELLASADAGKGEKVFKKCGACHTVDNGGANKVGPNLWNIVDRKPGSVDGFKYSAAMVTFGESASWDYDNLDGFLKKPKSHVSGTTMSFGGIKKPDQRADLIAYLRGFADSPAPLPAAEPEQEEETAPAAAE